MSKAKGLAWVAGACVVAGAVALGLPWAAKHVPWRFERWLAGVAGPPLAVPACSGRNQSGSVEALDKLRRRIYPLDDGDQELPITVEVVPGSTVNAFATLGGHIYVFDGLLTQAQSPEELAGVLAHEIAHLRNRHVMQGAAVNLFTLGALRAATPGGDGSGSRLAYLLLTLKFSRQQELEADDAGLERLRRARVDSAGLGRFYTRLDQLPAPPPIISDHPASGERAALAARYAGYPSEPVLAPNEWRNLRNICR